MEELKEAGIFLVALPRAAQRSSWSQTGLVQIDASTKAPLILYRVQKNHRRGTFS